MSHVVWTPVAESDLEDILFYIAYVARRPATATRILSEIRERVLHDFESGLPGQRHAHAPNDWLYLKHKRWLIFYIPRPEGGNEVMRVVDAVRDLPRQLRDR